MTKIKSKERHGDSLQFVNRKGRSDIILLDNISVILTETWHDQRKLNQCNETECIIKTTAKILKVGLSPSNKNSFFCFNESPLKMMKNAFYFISKALFVLQIFKFLS